MLISIARVRIKRIRTRSAYQLLLALFLLYLRRPVAVMHFSGQICLSILTALCFHKGKRYGGTALCPEMGGNERKVGAILPVIAQIKSHPDKIAHT